jgi:hypothetical protein
MQRQREALRQRRRAQPAIKAVTPTDGYLPTVDSGRMLFQGQRLTVRTVDGRHVAL